jgi:hypothetical protein
VKILAQVPVRDSRAVHARTHANQQYVVGIVLLRHKLHNLSSHVKHVKGQHVTIPISIHKKAPTISTKIFNTTQPRSYMKYPGKDFHTPITALTQAVIHTTRI